MADVPTTAKLSDLIGQIYDASLDDRLWSDFLINLTHSFGSDQALLLNVDTEPGPCGLLHTLNLDLGIVTRWEGSKEHDDPWYQAIQQIKRDMVYQGGDLCSSYTLHKSPFYIDSLSRLDIEHTLGGISFEQNDRNWVFAMYRDKRAGPFSERQREIYESLIPHFGRSIRIRNALSKERAGNVALSEALDQVSYGVYVINSEGSVLWMNGLAERIALECDGITIRYGSLRFWDYQIEKNFYAQAGNASAAVRDGVIEGNGFLSVPRPSLRPDYHLMVNPLNSNLGAMTLEPGAACVVFVHDPSQPKEISASLLEKLYGLTTAEAQVCVVLFESGSLPDAIDVLKISRNTAKSHLTHVFEKLGVKSQAQLLQLLALGFRRKPRTD